MTSPETCIRIARGSSTTRVEHQPSPNRRGEYELTRLLQLLEVPNQSLCVSREALEKLGEEFGAGDQVERVVDAAGGEDERVERLAGNARGVVLLVRQRLQSAVHERCEAAERAVSDVNGVDMDER